MAKETWAQRFSNTERIIFEKGNWIVTEDGEKVWSLYFQDKCIDPVSEFNDYVIFEKGFLLINKRGEVNRYSLFSGQNISPIRTLESRNLEFEVENGTLTFFIPNKNKTIAFDLSTLKEVSEIEEAQLSFDI